MPENIRVRYQALQSIILPDERRADRLALYARWPDGNVRLAGADGTIRIESGATLDLSTFFNAFSHAKWAKLTKIKTLCFQASGWGRVRILVCAYSRTGAALAVAEQILTLGNDAATIDLPDIASIPGTILAASITALGDDAGLASAQWATPEAPQREVRLAAVVTTFKREKAALSAMERFSTTTIPGCPIGSVHLYVIDNAMTLGARTLDGVTVIGNRNLGGAGGFARGLIEAMNAGRFTHALFMDDDASCEPSSVWRAMALSAYVSDTRSAIAGAMLHADDPTMQYEKGAIFFCRGRLRKTFEVLNHARNVGKTSVVAANDDDDIANYGAWWFFMFPIAAVRQMPFPFFVRGDDVDFSIANALKIVTLNGVASWCENFGHKLTPAVEYLAMRGWMTLALMHGDGAVAKSVFRRHLGSALTAGLRFDYATMNAMLDAMEHTCQGPQVFGDSPAPLRHLEYVNRQQNARKMTADDFARFVKLKRQRGLRRAFDKVVSKLLLGGHLRPPNGGTELPHVSILWEAPRQSLLKHDQAAYGRGREVEIFVRDRGAMLSACLRLLRIAVTMRPRIPRLLTAYQSRSGAYRRKEYWEKQFESPPDSTRP